MQRRVIVDPSDAVANRGQVSVVEQCLQLNALIMLHSCQGKDARGGGLVRVLVARFLVARMRRSFVASVARHPRRTHVHLFVTAASTRCKPLHESIVSTAKRTRH